MVRPDVVAKKISRAAGWLHDAEALLSQPQEQFLADGKARDLSAFYLFLAIQECIDIASHWVADSGWVPADDAASSFEVLAARGVVSVETADRMRAATGLRNRIAHGYALLDHGRLHAEASQGLKDLNGFLRAVAQALA